MKIIIIIKLIVSLLFVADGFILLNNSQNDSNYSSYLLVSLINKYWNFLIKLKNWRMCKWWKQSEMFEWNLYEWKLLQMQSRLHWNQMWNFSWKN